MERRKKVIAIVLGVGGIVLEMTFPQIPMALGVPILLVCSGILILAFLPRQSRAVIYGMPALRPIYPYLDRAIEMVGGAASATDTITAGDAIRALMNARPNSIETTESRLRDKASMGTITAWGKKAPKEAIRTFLPSLEKIPAEPGCTHRLIFVRSPGRSPRIVLLT